MKKLTSLSAVGASLLVIGASISSPIALAASSSPGSGQALQIAPPLLTLRANPGQVLKTNIKLQDITNNNLVVSNEINDFVAAGEGGIPKILTGNDSNNPFSLKNWITPLPAFTLSSHQIETLPITINVPKNASPGGHYGVIRFTGVPPNLKGTGVSLSASLGALVLLTVNGKLTHNLSVVQFSASKNGKVSKLFESAPLDFIVRLRNSGNIQEEPSGHIIVSDMFGKVVAGVNVNDPPRNILPDSIREFTGTLNNTELGGRRLFGLYHAKLTATYGTDTNQKKTLTDTITFWVIPFKLIGIIILLLIIAFFAAKYWLRRYKQRIVKKVQKSQKRPTKRRRM